ncbi:hypothetical protein HMPREF9151_01995 [Hoylesella saccharolytica F0055]|uniref:Uncharacterized protein n=1 Tax=Hoylesella saccharolytica F0055 TaxID=1127699 RepID=L1N4X6_9BACT|nr:hypothetical protein HMPREF9151_01995 [Hoylesella saccharolytica F0055]
MKKETTTNQMKKERMLVLFIPSFFIFYVFPNSYFLLFISPGDSLSIPSMAAVSNAECNTSLFGK